MIQVAYQLATVLLRVGCRADNSLAVIATAHPLGLHLEAISDRDEGRDLALIGFEIVGAHGFVLLLILGKVIADLIKTFLGSVKPPLEVLDLLVVLLITFVEGLEEAINEALQIFRGHFKNGQCSGHGSGREGEREGGSILSFLNRWRYGERRGRGDRGLIGEVD